MWKVALLPIVSHPIRKLVPWCPCSGNKPIVSGSSHLGEMLRLYRECQWDDPRHQCVLFFLWFYLQIRYIGCCLIIILIEQLVFLVGKIYFEVQPWKVQPEQLLPRRLLWVWSSAFGYCVELWVISFLEISHMFPLIAVDTNKLSYLCRSKKGGL